MSKPLFWRVLDSVIGAIMFTLAMTLALYKFSKSFYDSDT
jgi:L-lysine exporter family protein LysE/ArgO